MKYLYTTKHEEGCHKFGNAYGRPVHTYEEAALRKAGWADSLAELGAVEVEPEPVAEADEDAELAEARAQYEELFGEKPHHKAKLETIQAKIDEKLSND